MQRHFLLALCAVIPAVLATLVSFGLPNYQHGMLIGAGASIPLVYVAGLMQHIMLDGTMQRVLQGFVVALFLRFLGVITALVVVLLVAKSLLVAVVVTMTACVVVSSIADAALIMRSLDAKRGSACG